MIYQYIVFSETFLVFFVISQNNIVPLLSK